MKTKKQIEQEHRAEIKALRDQIVGEAHRRAVAEAAAKKQLDRVDELADQARNARYHQEAKRAEWNAQHNAMVKLIRELEDRIHRMDLAWTQDRHELKELHGELYRNRKPEVTDIGWAVARMLEGAHVTRRGWNGNGMSLRLIQGLTDNGKGDEVCSAVWMKTAHGNHVPWTCSQTDLLAFDWEVVP